MIRGLFLTLFCTCLLIASIASETHSNYPHFTLFNNPTDPAVAYSSDWESVSAWQVTVGKGTLLASYTRQLSQVSSAILEDGVVLLFAKGYDFEGVSKAEERPLVLPFYMVLANETAPHPYAWSYGVDAGKVEVAVSMHQALKEGFDSASNDIRLRFFVLPSTFLKQHKLTPMAARSLPYSQLVSLLSTTP